MSNTQVYWDLLHAEYLLGEFSSHIFMLDGVDTSLYNSQFISALHRILGAKAVLHLGKEDRAKLDSDFEVWVAERKQP